MTCAETKTIIVRCPDCSSEDIKQRKKQHSPTTVLLQALQTQFSTPLSKESMDAESAQVVAMTMCNSGIRDIEDVLDIHRDSVMAALKRAADAIPTAEVSNVRVVGTAELDEFWVVCWLQRTSTMDVVRLGYQTQAVCWHIATGDVLMPRAKPLVKSFLPTTTFDATTPMTGNHTLRCYRRRSLV